MNMIVAQIHAIETPKYGDSASSTQEIEPTKVSVRNHQILIILLSAITPSEGAHIATSNAPIITAAENIASAVHSEPRIFVEIPFASANKYANHAGKTAVVTDVSKALLPQSYAQYPRTRWSSAMPRTEFNRL